MDSASPSSSARHKWWSVDLLSTGHDRQRRYCLACPVGIICKSDPFMQEHEKRKRLPCGYSHFGPSLVPGGCRVLSSQISIGRRALCPSRYLFYSHLYGQRVRTLNPSFNEQLELTSGRSQRLCCTSFQSFLYFWIFTFFYIVVNSTDSAGGDFQGDRRGRYRP